MNNGTEVHQFNLQKAEGPSLISPLPEPGMTFMIYTSIQVLNHLAGIPKGFINHTFWEPQSLPLVALERERWDKHQLVPWTGPAPIWIELTINNLDANGHPFHLVSLSRVHVYLNVIILLGFFLARF